MKLAPETNIDLIIHVKKTEDGYVSIEATNGHWRSSTTVDAVHVPDVLRHIGIENASSAEAATVYPNPDDVKAAVAWARAVRGDLRTLTPYRDTECPVSTTRDGDGALRFEPWPQLDVFGAGKVALACVRAKGGTVRFNFGDVEVVVDAASTEDSIVQQYMVACRDKVYPVNPVTAESPVGRSAERSAESPA